MSCEVRGEGRGSAKALGQEFVWWFASTEASRAAAEMGRGKRRKWRERGTEAAVRTWAKLTIGNIPHISVAHRLCPSFALAVTDSLTWQSTAL